MNTTIRSSCWFLPVFFVVLAAALVVYALVRTSRAPESMQEGGAVDPVRYAYLGEGRPTAPVDPCSLLSEETVARAIGLPVGGPQTLEVDNPLGEQHCVFPSASDPSEPLVRLVTVFQEGMDPVLVQNGYTVQHLFQGKRVGEGRVQDVMGIDHEAFWGGVGEELWNGLHVRTADVYLQVRVNLDDSGKALQSAKIIAVAALRNLFR